MKFTYAKALSMMVFVVQYFALAKLALLFEMHLKQSNRRSPVTIADTLKRALMHLDSLNSPGLVH